MWILNSVLPSLSQGFAWILNSVLYFPYCHRHLYIFWKQYFPHCHRFYVNLEDSNSHMVIDICANPKPNNIFFFSLVLKIMASPKSRLHDHIQLDIPQLVRLLRMNDQSNAANSTWQHMTLTSMPPTGFEPTIPTGEQLQSHTLDCVATGSAN